MPDRETELGRKLSYRFKDAALLARALRHRSGGADHNERLEFLGDSLLSFVIAAELYERFPDLPEGELTRLRARLVREETLAAIARELGLGRFLELGGGEYKSGGYDRDSILADAFEALLGAVYRDGGLEAARAVILRLYTARLAAIDPREVLKDPKTLLQEYLQKRALSTPTYTLLEVAGEAHNPCFVVECRVPGLTDAVRGQGATRRGAEQEAAAAAYRRLSGAG